MPEPHVHPGQVELSGKRVRHRRGGIGEGIAPPIGRSVCRNAQLIQPGDGLGVTVLGKGYLQKRAVGAGVVFGSGVYVADVAPPVAGNVYLPAHHHVAVEQQDMRTVSDRFQGSHDAGWPRPDDTYSSFLHFCIQPPVILLRTQTKESPGVPMRRPERSAIFGSSMKCLRFNVTR